MSKALQIIFMGTPEFAVPALNALLESPDEVVAVVTQPDKAKGRGKKLQPPPVKEVALAAGIPVLQPEGDIASEAFLKGLVSYKPDLIVVAAFGKILPKSILELPPMGCINIHGSLLPKYRGAAPIQRALINNEAEVGVTIMQMAEGMDTGDMLCKAKIRPDSDETSGTLFEKLAVLGSGSMIKAIKGLKEGTIFPTPQKEGDATYAPRLKKEDGFIDWSKSAEELEPLIRGLDPWPAAFCFINGKRLRLFKPETIAFEGDAGSIIEAGERGLIIACGKGALVIDEVQPEGKKRMPATDWLRGAKIESGTLLNQEHN